MWLSQFRFKKFVSKEKGLKYGFCNKSLQKDEPLTRWTLFWAYLPWLLGGYAVAPTHDKYAQKSVQRVRGSSFLLSYFRKEIKSKDAKTVTTSNQVRKTNTSITRNSGRNWWPYIILDKKIRLKRVSDYLKGCAMNYKSFRLSDDWPWITNSKYTYHSKYSFTTNACI